MSIGDFFSTLLAPFKMIFGDPDESRIIATGTPAMAKIVSLDESGIGTMTVNDQPFVSMTLEVYVEGQAPYQVVKKTIIPRLSVSQFQPGAMLRVKVDPTNPQKVVFDTTPVADAALPKVGNTDRPDIVGGKKGFAELLSLKKTEQMKNGLPVYSADLEVTGEGMEKYTFTKEFPLPEYALTMFLVGKKYACTVDSSDKTKVELVIR